MSLAPTTAISHDRLGEVDTSAVAQWVVDQYEGNRFPAVVIGSAHGSAGHVAAALPAPFLPVAFEVDVLSPDRLPDDLEKTQQYGQQVAALLIDRNPPAGVRHVHDPVRHGQLATRTTTHCLHWHELSGLIEHSDRLQPGADVVVIKDERPWPVIAEDGGNTFSLAVPPVA